MSAPRSALIVRMSSIGDVVHTLPAFEALRAAWPHTTFGWAVESTAIDLVRRLPVQAHELNVQRWRQRWWTPEVWRQVRAATSELRAARYEIAIDFQGLLKSSVVARLSGASTFGLAAADTRERLAGWLLRQRAAPSPSGCHAITRALHLAAAAGAGDATVRWPNLVTADDARFVAQHLESGERRPILLHAVANWASKQYEPERFVEVARRLHDETARPVLWVWGPGELDDIAALAAQAGPGSRPAIPTRLPQLAALLERAALFIGGDSGPLHLAVACGTPVVGIFGPTDPEQLGPIEVADRVVVRKLSCSHCHRRVCPLGTNECLTEISAADIVTAALDRLRAGAAHKEH